MIPPLVRPIATPLWPLANPSIEDSYSTNRTVDGKTYRLDIIDTAGQEEYRDMLGSLFSADSTIDGYLLVYDITSRTSLENLEYFDELIQKNVESGLRPTGDPLPVKIVAGNKCDLADARTVSSAEGLAWAKAHGCGFMETSAKVMVNIEETFETLIRQVNQNRIDARGPSATTQPNPRLNSAGPAVGGLNVKQTTSNSNLRAKEEPKKRSDCCIIC